MTKRTGNNQDSSGKNTDRTAAGKSGQILKRAMVWQRAKRKNCRKGKICWRMWKDKTGS